MSDKMLCPKHMRIEAASWSPSYPKIGTRYLICEPGLDSQGRLWCEDCPVPGIEEAKQ